MADVLSDAFRADLHAGSQDAAVLAGRARTFVRSSVGSSEDSEEDILRRLQDPKLLGSFAESLLADSSLPDELRESLVERVFDLLPLPQSEGEVLLVEDRSPPGLLALASFLAGRDRLTVLHGMHLVYAVFLDRALFRRASRPDRARVLDRMVRLDGATERLRWLYVGFHLGAVSEAEAVDALRSLLRARDLADPFKRGLAALVSEEDGGIRSLMGMAQEEGLLPGDDHEPGAPAVVANVPRLPSRLAPLGRRWIRRHEARFRAPGTA